MLVHFYWIALHYIPVYKGSACLYLAYPNLQDGGTMLVHFYWIALHYIPVYKGSACLCLAYSLTLKIDFRTINGLPPDHEALMSQKTVCLKN
jgi:hypothetical protein